MIIIIMMMMMMIIIIIIIIIIITRNINMAVVFLSYYGCRVHVHVYLDLFFAADLFAGLFLEDHENTY